MSDAVPPELKAGGTLGPGHVYIVRREDETLFKTLRQGEYAHVLTSRQMGKSSMMVRTKLRLEGEGVRCATLDLTMLGTRQTAEGWFRGFVHHIARELNLGFDGAAWWAASTLPTTNQKLTEFCRDEVLSKIADPVVIFIDEIDTTLKLDFTDDFFLAIRWMYNNRSQDQAWTRLTFCLLGVATPNELIKAQRSTPYNIGTGIEVNDFDPEHDDLSALEQTLAPNGKERLAAVLHWTGGHPYLTTRLCAELRGAGEADVEQLVEAKFRSLAGARRDPHFEQVIRYVDERVQDRIATLSLYRRAIRGRGVEDRSSLPHAQLKLAGLVRRERDGRLVVRNPIYARLFDRRWVRAYLPRRRAMLVRGAVAAMAVSLLYVFVLLPRPYIRALEAGLLDVAPVREAYDNLRRIPFYSRTANKLLADFWERRAYEEKHGFGATLAMLQTIRFSESDRRRRVLGVLLGRQASLHVTFWQWDDTATEGSVNAIAFKPDGSQMAASRDDRTVRLFDSRTLAPRGNPLRLDGWIWGTAVAFSPDGSILATAWDDGTARLFDATTLAPHGNPLRLGGWHWITPVAFSADGRLLATTCYDSTTRVFDSETLAPRQTLRNEKAITALAFSPDGRLIATVGDGPARLFDAKTLAPRRELRLSEGTITAISFSLRGGILAAGGDRGARLFDTETLAPRSEQLVLDSPVQDLAISADGSLMAIASKGTAQVFDAPTMTPRGTRLRLDGAIRTIAFSPDSSLIAAAGDDRTVRAFDARTSEDQARIVGGEVNGLAFSPDGSLLAIACDNGTTHIVDAHDLSPRSNPLSDKPAVLAVAFSPNDDLLVTASDDGVARFFDAKTLEPRQHPPGVDGAIRALAFSGDGNLLATSGNDGVVRLLGAKTLKPEGPPLLLDDPVRALALSPGGNFLVLATGGNETTARLFDTKTRTLRGELPRHNSGILALAFSPDGSTLATASADHYARIFDTRTLKPKGAPLRHDGRVTAVAFSPDGRLLVTASGDRVLMWDLATRSPMNVPPIQGDPEALFEEWSKKLGLTIDDDWNIVPPHR